jgi:Tol biopolymer transport system component
VAAMVPEDVYELTGAFDPRVSPDGRTVAYQVLRVDREANQYRSAIWVAAADGSEEPRQLTAGAKKDGSPRWSPDGSRIAFTSNRESDTPQLYVMPFGGGEPRRLTNLKGGVTDPAWSPDGTRILFVARVPDPAYEETDDKRRAPRRFTRLQYKLDNEGWTGDRRQQLFSVAVDGSREPEQLTDGDFEHDGACWSPDGSRIAFASARDDDWDISTARDIYVMDANGGGPDKLTTTDGEAERPSWSPDGGRVAFLFKPGVMDDPRHAQIAVLDVATGERRILTEALDRNCSPYPALREPAWDGDDLLFAVEDRGNTHLYRVPADGSGKPEVMVGGDLTVGGWDAAAGVVAHTMSTPTT